MFLNRFNNNTFSYEDLTYVCFGVFSNSSAADFMSMYVEWAKLKEVILFECTNFVYEDKQLLNLLERWRPRFDPLLGHTK